MTKISSFFLLLLFLLGLTSPGFAQDIKKKGQVLFNLGVFAYESGDYKTAENHFKKALSFDSSHAYLNYYLGKVYLQKENYSQAAVYFDKAIKTEKNLPDLAYNWAYVNYKLDNFPAAEKLFGELATSEPDNVLAHYYAGLSLYKQEQHRQALKYLSRAARMDTPARYNADYHAAICDLHLKNTDSARERLTRVIENAAEDDLRRSAAELLKKMDLPERQPRRYSLVAKAGWEYDDNEVLEPIDNDDLYANEEDHILSGYLSASYDFIRTDNFIMGAGYSHYLTIHDEFDEYDLSGSLFDLYARYRVQDYTFTISYNPEYYWLDSESYLCRQEITSTVSRKFGNFLTEISYNHQQDNNMYDSEQDGYANEVFLRSRYDLPEKSGALRAGVGYAINSADHRDHDYDMITTELAAAFNLWWGLSLALCGECEIQKYDNVDSSYGEKRDDTRYTGNILFSRNIVEDMVSAHIGYEYTKNNSSIDDFGRYGADHKYESNAVKVFLAVKI